MSPANKFIATVMSYITDTKPLKKLSQKEILDD